MTEEHYEGGTPKTLVKLEAANASIANLDDALEAAAKLVTRIADLERELELQRKLVAGLESDLAEKDRRIGRLVVELGAARMMQRSDFAERTASELRDARARIAELEARVKEYEAELKAQATEANKRIAELEAFIKGPTVFGTTSHD
jgi:chromosome segregation ATPase